MHAIQRVRSALFLFAALTALAMPAVAAGDHGGGGGGGGTPPPPTGAPAVTFTPTSLTFAAQAIGTTSAPQSITVTNTRNASLFVTQVDDGCSGLTLAAGTSCSVSITFSPTATGTRSATFILTDSFFLALLFWHTGFGLRVLLSFAWSSLTAPFAAHVLTVLYYRLADATRPVIDPEVLKWRSVWEGR